jgi:hypothetical protein
MTRMTALAAASALVVVTIVAASPVDAQQLKGKTNPPSPWTGCCTTCILDGCAGCSEISGNACGAGMVKANCTTKNDNTSCSPANNPATKGIKAN